MLLNRYSVYHVAELVHIEAESAVAVSFFSIPDGMIVDCVVVVVKVPCTNAVNLIVGDEDDDNGFIVAASADAAAGTVYGADPTERGAYLYDATKKGAFRKVYQAAKNLKLVLSGAAGAAKGEYLVYILGHRAIQLP